MKVSVIGRMAWAVIIVCATVMVSCSRGDAEIQSVIPDDSRVVARMDLGAVIDAMGGKITADGLTLPEGVSGTLFLGADGADVAAAMGQLQAAVDINNVYFSRSAKNLTYLVAEVKDGGKLAEVAAKQLKMQPYGDRGDFDEVYNAGYTTMLVRGNLCWIVPQSAEDAVDELSKVLTRAAKSDFGKVPSVADAVSGTGAMANVAVLTSAKAAEWMVMECSSVSGDVRVEVVSYDNQGKPVVTKGSSEIQLDFLRYVPGDFNVALAMGVSREYDWNRFFGLFEGSDNFKVAGFMEVLRPFLESADGTIALAAKFPVTPKVDEGEMAVTVHPFVAMIHMDQAQVNSCLENLKSLLKKNFMTVTDGGNGMFRAGFGPQGALYFGNVDGYLAIGTSPFEPTAMNSLTPVFQGKTLAASVNLSSLQGISPAVKDGLDLTVEGSDVNTVIVIKPAGGSNPLVRLFTLLSAL